ncbi:hypothetical protein GOBAR_DD19723 [Gossypium barbadense]|nr:hypothetical protein GOBAR_DD19723 [Gossypium barbadense]
MAAPIWVWAFYVALTLFPSVLGNSEGDALYTLRRSLSDPDNVLQSWDPTLVNPCTWFHITCNQDNRVTRVRLNDNRLTGPIPRELVGISSLKVVIKAHGYQNIYLFSSSDVSNNDLCGTIPTSGPFEHIPLNNFEENPRLEGPELLGLASYDTNCS